MAGSSSYTVPFNETVICGAAPALRRGIQHELRERRDQGYLARSIRSPIATDPHCWLCWPESGLKFVIAGPLPETVTINPFGSEASSSSVLMVMLLPP